MAGHTFYVVGEGPDKYDSVIDGGLINDKIHSSNGSTNVFQFRDVVTLFPSQVVENKTSGADCGWVAVRMMANNPGLWLVHWYENK